MKEARGSKRWALALTASGLFFLASAGAALAKCGDSPGDLDAVATVRGNVNSTCDCDAATSHSAHVACARAIVETAMSDGSLPRQCGSTVLRCARKSICGRKAGYVPCCRTSRLGVTRCSIKSSVSRCRAPSGGSACFSTFAKSCCESCNNGGCIQPTPTLTPTPRPTPTPPGFCQDLVPLPALGQVPISVLPGTTECGGEGFNPPPVAPFSGQVSDGDGAKLQDLGLGCLYTGILPPTKLSSGGSSLLDVKGIGLGTITLGGSEGTGPLDCTKGSGPLKHCMNGKPGTDGMGLCDTDGDCNQVVGACLLDANCYYGPPVPVGGAFPACTVNALLTDMCGSLDITTFNVNIMVAISSRIYLTFDAESPCPQCVAGTCSAGKNVGLPCTALGSYNTSPDCPPRDNQFTAALQVVVPQLTSGTSTLTADENGNFCEGQSQPGAFGMTGARTITQTGTGVVSGGLSGESVAVGTFCIYPTGNPVIDISGGFPAAGALSAKSSINIADVILP